MLLRLLKEHFFFSNLASWFCSLIPPAVEHNFAKYRAIGQAMYLTGAEHLDGDYLEFGVFTGGSLVAATRYDRRLRKTLGNKESRFFGFDSFDGFGQVKPEDKHPFFIDGLFRVDEMKTRRNIGRNTRGSKVELVKGDFRDSLTSTSAKDLGIKRARVVFIDCDLKEPAELALAWSGPALQVGTVVILDDYYAFRGRRDRGVAGAFDAFQEQHPQFQFRSLFKYGFGGAAFIVSDVK